MANITKMQVETAEQVLNQALERRVKQIAAEAFKNDMAKIMPDLKDFNKKAIALYEEAKKLKAKVEKNPKLQVDLDDYNSPVKRLPKTIDDLDTDCFIGVKGSSWNNKAQSYEPDVSKEKEEITRYILGLKLGTTMLADLDKMIEKFSKIK